MLKNSGTQMKQANSLKYINYQKKKNNLNSPTAIKEIGFIVKKYSNKENSRPGWFH